MRRERSMEKHLWRKWEIESCVEASVVEALCGAAGVEAS